MEKSQVNVIGSAASALGAIGSEPAQCVPVLVQVLKQYKAFQGPNDPRWGVLGAVADFRPEARFAVKAIVDIATDPKEDSLLRERAVKVLHKIGPKAKEAIPALRQLRAIPWFAQEAKKALEAIEGPSK